MPNFTKARESLQVFSKVVGHALTDWQCNSLQLRKRTTVIVAPRQSGKSRSLSVLALWKAFATPGLRVLVISAGDDAAKRLLAEVRHVAVSSPLLRGSVVDDYAGLVTLSNGSEIRSVPASERQIRGWSVDLLLVDEAALVADELLTSAAYPTTAARPDARIVLASSATAASGSFYDRAQAGLTGAEHTETFLWALADAKWISASVIEAARESMTPTRFAAEYLGEFASGADALFPRHLLDRATADFEMPGLYGLQGLSVLGGVDWGATQDRCALTCIGRLREPAGAFAVLCSHAWRSGEPMDGPGGVVPQIAELPANWEQLTVETNGLGRPLAESLARQLQGRRVKIENVNTDQSSKSTTYSTLRMLLEQGKLLIPASATELLRELLLLRVSFTQTGGERIEAGVGHDDFADSLYLAAGPWRDKKGKWHTRLGKAAEGSAPRSIEPEEGEEVVTTGSGLTLPRTPELVGVGGERFGPPQLIPQWKNPWASPAERKAAKLKAGIIGWDWGASQEMQEVKGWFDDFGFNSKRGRRR